MSAPQADSPALPLDFFETPGAKLKTDSYAAVSFPIGLFPPKLFEYKIPEALRGQVQSGSWVLAPFRRRGLWGAVAEIYAEARFGGPHGEIIESVTWPDAIRLRTLALAKKMARHYAAGLAHAFKTALPFPRLLPQETRPSAAIQSTGADPELNDEQRQAFEALLHHAGEGRRQIYLWGPTGSGKTYVLLAFIKKLLAQNRSVIYMVPEIALTPQFLELFESELTLGPAFACWNSRVSGAQKKTLWNRMLSGEIRFVLGTRSAVFLPLTGLGAVIIDEEQDSSFKQETPPPAYHARDVALWRAEEEEALAVFASATPSLECYHAIEAGLLPAVRLEHRFGGSTLPAVRLESLSGPVDGLDAGLIQTIRATIETNRHVLVYHNRRGFNRVLTCEHCKTSVLCNQCQLPLTLHREEAAVTLRCHHCGIRKKPPESCPRCRAPKEHLKPKGVGTQRIAQDIEEALGLKILRLDRDTAKTSAPIYAEFKAGQSKILVGTKMVTKGWNFPLVTLVVVLDADNELVLPDFRACERAFQTLCQVSGRAGRGRDPGEVLIRTRNPDHYLFQSLVAHDLNLFYQREIEIRRRMRLPPVTRLFTIELKGSKREKVEEAARSMLDALRAKGLETNMEAMGAGPSFFQKIRQNWRFQVVLRSNDPGAEFPMDALGPVVSQFRKSGVMLKFHPDPQNLL
ncbi:MAG: primosomal protein N' [Elusimicrobia bacterium]|nr:primosomal protein N' [Elusimicrobiota bacterium]